MRTVEEYRGRADMPDILRGLFDDDAVRPFNERNEDCRVAELGSPLIQICFRDPTGPGARTSSKDRNVPGDNFVQRFAKRRPAHRQYGIYHRLAKQRSGLGKKENLDVVPGLGKHKPVRERKCGPGWVVGSPGALHHNFQLFRRGLRFGRAQGEKRQAGEPGQKKPTHHVSSAEKNGVK
jgi:hypothetical protein